MRDAMCAATVGNNACERGEGCVSAVFNAGGGALMVAHKGQSSFGVLGLPESSPVTISFIMPEPVQTNIVDSGLTRGEAIATPNDKANHTSTRRVICIEFRRPHMFALYGYLLFCKVTPTILESKLTLTKGQLSV